MANEDWKNEKKSSDADQAPDYRYRWNYAEQYEFDQRNRKKKKRSGAVLYALITATVFLLCFAMLAGMLVWYERQDHGAGGTQGNHTNQGTSGVTLTTPQVSEIITPTTVLVYAQSSTGYAYGTGFFITEDGYIATNYHVVRDSDYFAVSLASAPTKMIKAELVGYRANEDLAVLKIEGTGYPVPAIGDSDKLRVGQTVVAVGNPRGDEGAWSTSQGIISALNRQVEVSIDKTTVVLSLIQTDAALNPGNSGGPLCNDRAEVIGIVARKHTDSEGISYAIPICGAMEILEAIIEKGHADDVNPSFSKVRPVLGINCVNVQKGDSFTYNGTPCIAEVDGILVTGITSGSSVDGKLEMIDIIVAFDGKKVKTVEELTGLLYNYSAGNTVTIRVHRNGEEIDVKVKLLS